MAAKSSTGFLTPNIRLLVTKGNDAGKVFESNRYPVILGRDESADFPLSQDSNISRKHAKLELEDGAVYFEDLNSTNGSFINNIRITKRTHLKSGSNIILGNTWIKFIIFRPGQKTEEKPKKKESIGSTFFTETKKLEAIFVLDLHDSSGVANRYGDDVAMKLTEDLNKIALPVFSNYKSQFNKGTGDGYLVTFKRVDQALAAAVDILKKVRARNARKQGVEKLHIRICLNFGQCTIEPNGDRHGNAVNITFRAEGVKYKDMKRTRESISSKEFPENDRIFVTEEYYKELSDKLKKRFELIGNFKLKGIKELHPVYNFKYK